MSRMGSVLEDCMYSMVNEERCYTVDFEQVWRGLTGVARAEHCYRTAEALPIARCSLLCRLDAEAI